MQFIKCDNGGETYADQKVWINMRDRKMFLFAYGVGRSGTTALCEALNLHHKIVMGVERYKYRMIGKSFLEVGPELFEKEQFLLSTRRYIMFVFMVPLNTYPSITPHAQKYG